MRTPVGLLVFAILTVIACWYWLGAPVAMPPSPLAPGEKLTCVSYAPFRANQNPLDPATHVEPWQIEEDLVRLAAVTDCVRTYSVEFGLDQVAPIAERHGLTVMQGLWLSGVPEKNRREEQTVVDIVKRNPGVIRAVVVGNEVLLRGEMSALDLADTIRRVKTQVGAVPVTYADVWEFWLRNRELLSAVDFVTIHILPYWEDFPVRASRAAGHVESIRQRVAQAFPGKEILIGETGWPSRGRMRDGALPSPANEARVMHEVLALAKEMHYRVNLIEAFDQPWKRHLEGTVGGYWGLLDAYARQPKFAWGQGVSNHPRWRLQAVGGAILTALVFAAAYATRRRAKRDEISVTTWVGIALCALAGGTLAPWAIENGTIESLGAGGALRSTALVAVAIAMPVIAGAALVVGTPIPGFGRVLARKAARPASLLALVLGVGLIAVAVLALHAALGLVFDPRYRDFPFAALGAAVLPLFVLQILCPERAGAGGRAERAAALVLGLCAVYVALNEGFANWQAQWFCGELLVIGVILLRSRDAPGSG